MITGRPARQALALGGLDEVGAAIGEAGKELYLFGQYGNERWSSTNRRIISPAPAARAVDLPARAAAAAAPRRRRRAPTSRRRAWPSPCTPGGCADPTRRFERLLPVLARAGRAARPVVEPGRSVDRGALARACTRARSVETLVEELEAGGFLFAGDDLGDLEAFEAVAALRDDGLPTLLVCSASDEE